MVVDESMIEQYENRIREAQMNSDAANLGRAKQEMMMQEQEQQSNSINEQLDTSKTLERMHNLLKGYVLQDVGNGTIQWVKPESNDLIVLSEYGVNYIMQVLSSYVCENTLLSNYDDKQIDAKMEDISNTINDNIFMEYDKMFFEPTMEECQEEIKKRIQARVNIRAFALHLMDKKVDKDVIEAELLKDMEGRVERELQIIREQKMKSKLKRFESLIRMVQDTIHSAYQRAWRGQERSTARSHISVSETKGGMVMPQQSSSPFGILGRR